ncbi:MAG: sulfotransferase family 2 domain-containing protein [Nocardioides sp.]|nr:sulfotransferase family 2 domain-containing protein [Nocardioides sp.]
MTSSRRLTRAALQSYWPNSLVDHRVHPLPEYNCIYVRNAKVGTGTTLLWLHRVHTGDFDFSPLRSIHAEHRLPAPQDVGWENVADMLEGEAFRFTFVRDPFRRVESAYRNKVLERSRGRGRRAPAVTQGRRTRLRRIKTLQTAIGLRGSGSQDLTFDQYIAALEVLADRNALKMDAHFRPQHLNLMHGLISYDLIGRLETFEADLEKVREATGMPPVPVEVGRNASPDSATSLFDGRPDLLKKVKRIYARDFELYGY